MKKRFPESIFRVCHGARAEEDTFGHSPFDADALALQSGFEVARLAGEIFETAFFGPVELSTKAVPHGGHERAPYNELGIVLEGMDGSDGVFEDGASLDLDVDRIPSHDALSLNTDESMVKCYDTGTSRVLQ